MRVEAPINVEGLPNVDLRGGSSGSGITTVFEIEDLANTGFLYPNFSCDDLTMWSQFSEKIDLSILSGRVETKLIVLISSGHGTINMRDGLLHADKMEGGDVNINMLAGGTGAIVWDELDSSASAIPVNFASDNLGSITLGMWWDPIGGTNKSTVGIWEWFRDNGRLSIDGQVDTSINSYIITYGTVEGSTNGWASTLRLSGALTPEENYAVWAAGFGLVATNESGATTTDFELDGLDNLTEYALGGNPTDDDAADINPTLSGPMAGTNTMAYVYTRRTDATHRGLSYTLTMTTDDLPSATWTSLPVGAWETGSGPAADPLFESVTNAVPTDTPIGFVNLEVTPTF